MTKHPSNLISGQKILVTGASGFIGSHLCHKLREKGGKIHAISRIKRSSQNNEIQWWQANLIDTGKVQELLEEIRPDIIYHLAAFVSGTRDLSYTIPIFNSNLLATVNLLNASAKIGCKRFFLIGSMEEPDSKKSEVIPSSPYSAAKWASSAYGRMFHALYRLPIVLLRIFMVYGPGQKDLKKLVPYVTLCLLQGKAPLLSSGHRLIDWIYVEDVVECLTLLVTASDIEGKTIDIGSGKLLSIRSIVEKLVEIINPEIKPQFGALRDRMHENESAAIIKRTKLLLNWEPKISLDEGLIHTTEWYRKMLLSSNFDS